MLLTRDVLKRTAAVVEQGGDAIAGLPSLQVRPLECVFVKFSFYKPNPQAAILFCLPAACDNDRNDFEITGLFFMHIVRTAPTVTPPSQTTGTPEITLSPQSSLSSTSQGTQTYNQITFLCMFFHV